MTLGQDRLGFDAGWYIDNFIWVIVSGTGFDATSREISPLTGSSDSGPRFR